MGFDAPAGTRGARQPRAGLMMRWVNKMAARRIRRTGKMAGLGFNALILTTVGAKSGAQRTNPVGWFPGPDGSWLIVASAAGAARNPAWYHNIAAHPDQVTIELNRRTIPVTASHPADTPIRLIRAAARAPGGGAQGRGGAQTALTARRLRRRSPSDPVRAYDVNRPDTARLPTAGCVRRTPISAAG